MHRFVSPDKFKLAFLTLELESYREKSSRNEQVSFSQSIAWFNLYLQLICAIQVMTTGQREFFF